MKLLIKCLSVVPIFLLGGMLLPSLNAQSIPQDSLVTQHLEEVILIGRKQELSGKLTKPLTSLEGYLQESGRIDMVKRGGYAWEPVLNNMTTERTVITIDGMRIFSACTDKMDPVTSYVEISNLAEANVSSGQAGSGFGATVGGSIDLRRIKSGLVDSGWRGSLHTGIETNNWQKIMGGGLSYADTTFFFDTNVMYRDAQNYHAGGNREILYSQYNKLNVSATTGMALAGNKSLEAAIIYDKATDVGYPALPMDVSLAEALITSLEYQVVPRSPLLNQWNTKLYFNTVTHIMDDSHRPDVPIRMDMPGWSDTYGLNSNVEGIHRNHQFKLGLTSYYNQSLAQMTMYPENPQEKSMFMYTWPDVGTWYTGVSFEDQWDFTDASRLQLSGALGYHLNDIHSDQGLQSLQIFHPNLSRTTTHTLGSIAGHYYYQEGKMRYHAGVGYGSRAPSVSEGYGFYLFNSFDAYDYIGNPHLNPEKSAEFHSSLSYQTYNLQLDLKGSLFHITDYIIGVPDPVLSPMTIGAHGVKVYQGLAHANLWNVDFHIAYDVLPLLKWHGQLIYNHGEDSEGRPLPLISPLSYKTSLDFRRSRFSVNWSVEGNASQTRYSPDFGEDRTPAFAVMDFSTTYRFLWNGNSLTATAGIGNILDTYYSSYSDWNNIPRMGRNLFLHVSYRW